LFNPKRYQTTGVILTIEPIEQVQEYRYWEMSRGKFITLEGIDGAGKSTHINWLESFLRGRGKTVIVTREPGGTPIGEALRRLLLDNGQVMHPETEALLMFAARREHLDKVILPALNRGDWVISDRFTDASFAYQGGGRKLSQQKLDALEHYVQGEFQPDLTLYFDVAVETARMRTNSVKLADRFEEEQDDFFHRVREAYQKRAKSFPERIRVIDANQCLEEVKKLVEDSVLSFCND
jgi:dTMP kinase